MKNYLSISLLILTINGCSAQDKQKILIDGKEVPIFDSGSEFFYEKIQTRLAALDTTLTPKHLLAYTYFVQQTAPFNPSDLDDKASKMYEWNEKGKFQQALEMGREILSDSPNNITAFKEMAFAFKRLEQSDSVNIYFALMIKAIEGAKLSGDGGAEKPYVLNNWFELRSLIEATTGLYATQKVIFKDRKDRILGFAIVESPKMGRFGLLNQWSKYLKKGEYVEGELSGEKSEEEFEQQLKKELKNLGK